MVLYFLKYVSERVNRACLYTMNIEFRKIKIVYYTFITTHKEVIDDASYLMCMYVLHQ